MLTAFPAIGGPLPKLAPLVAEGLRDLGFEVAIRGWSAHRVAHESPAAKIIERSGDLAGVVRHVKRWQPDVIYVATAHNRSGLLRDIPLALALPKGASPLVVHFHGSESGRLGGGRPALFDMASRLLVDRAAAVLLLSEEERDEWRRFRPGVRYEVVLNPFVPPAGAAVERAGDSEERPPELLCIARLIRSKGVFDLLDGFGIVRRSIPCRLRIAGIGPESEALRRRILLMGLEDDVDLLGYIEGGDLDRVYHEADAFVLPSYFAEGFPLSIMEAMSYGLPVVTTPIRGCADHLVEGKNALFVPPRRPDLIAAALKRLLGDEALRRRLGAANRLKVADFAPDRVIPAYAAVLDEAARAAGRYC
jgi:glycosyltransferase involved in cell wall biosynthesis